MSDAGPKLRLDADSSAFARELRSMVVSDSYEVRERLMLQSC